MRCMILAGGRGTRLGMLTAAVNKHLLPVGNKPMIMHSFDLLHHAGVGDIMLVTNAENVGDFTKLIATRHHPLDKQSISITPQFEPAGIADAIKYGNGFCHGGPVFVLLGDNVFQLEDQINFGKIIASFRENPVGAHIWTTEVENPSDYGVLCYRDNEMIGIAEKPEMPASNSAVVGAYLFDHRIWEILPTLVKSARGEYEVTDIIRVYLGWSTLQQHSLQGEWHDLGRSVRSYYQIASRSCYDSDFGD